MKKRTLGRLIATTLLALLGSACAALPSAPRGGATPESAPVSQIAPAAPPAPGAPAPAAAPAALDSARRAAPQASQVSPVDTGDRLIIRTGSLVLLVEDVPRAASQAQALASQLNGYVVSSAQREDGGRPTATVTLRVPADRFDEAMGKLKELAIRVNNEQVSTKDVTEEFVDTDARLRTLRATEERYLELLRQARSVEDVLKIEQQLTNIRTQIEQVQGRLQFLQRSTQTSTITVELRPYLGAQSPAGGWDLLPDLRNALAALLATLQFLASFLIWALVFTPIWLPIVLLVRAWRRRRRARRAAPPTPAAPVAPTPSA